MRGVNPAHVGRKPGKRGLRPPLKILAGEASEAPWRRLPGVNAVYAPHDDQSGADFRQHFTTKPYFAKQWGAYFGKKLY